jgi:membrane protein
MVARWLGSARSFGGPATVIGVVFLLWGSSRLVAQLDVALRIVFDPDSARPGQPVARAVLRKVLSRLAAIGWTLLLGAWVAASIVSRRALSYVWPHHALLGVARTGLALASLTLAVAVAYKMLPSRGIKWRQALEGAAITSGLLTLGSWLLELWFTRVRVRVGLGYGATGGLVVFLLWLYVSAQIFLFGAEISAAVLRRNQPAT